MNLIEYSNEFRSEEIHLLMHLLGEEGAQYSKCEVKVIADLPTEIGLELFYLGHKVAELYCAESKNGLTGEFQVYSSKNWSEPVILSAKEVWLYIFGKFT